ncbi:MAG: rhodanese-like domain-containing protein [Henriciella sp.]|uniref:rhodanese-like domain-containing protein n=1 Tax=Henriciella sp. TaxID=1968823 RepID=UPI0032EE2FA8
MVRRTGGLLIDVRTPEEWKQTGVPVTAHTVSVDDSDFIYQVDRITGGDKNQRIALICRTGDLSGQARERLIKAGYQNVTIVAGGVSGPNGWIDADLPVRPYR